MSNQAFDAKRTQIFHLDPFSVVIIGLDTADGPEHPLYDPRVLLPVSEGKSREAQQGGIRQAIAVVKDQGATLCKWGRQRIRWARRATELNREAGIERIVTVPCRLVGEKDRETGIEVDDFDNMIIENEHRENDSPYVKALKIQQGFKIGKTRERLAELFDVTPQMIDKWHGLLDLSAKVQDALYHDRISTNQAYEMKGLPHAEQDKLLPKQKKKLGRPKKIQEAAKVPESSGAGTGPESKESDNATAANNATVEKSVNGSNGGTNNGNNGNGNGTGSNTPKPASIVTPAPDESPETRIRRPNGTRMRAILIQLEPLLTTGTDRLVSADLVVKALQWCSGEIKEDEFRDAIAGLLPATANSSN